MKRFTDEGKEDVFRLRTTNLPGMSEDKMTPEGAAAGALLLGLAVWAFVIILKLLALVLGDLIRRGEVFGDCGGARVARDRGAVIF